MRSAQIRCLRFWGSGGCLHHKSLPRLPGTKSAASRDAIAYVSRFVAVAADQGDPVWEATLQALDVQLVSAELITV